MTEFESGDNSFKADENDIVPYSGLVTFAANSDSASLFITVLQDDFTEPREFFKIKLAVRTRGDDVTVRGWITSLFEGSCKTDEGLKCIFENQQFVDMSTGQVPTKRERLSTSCSSFLPLHSKTVPDPWCYTSTTAVGICNKDCPGAKKVKMNNVADGNKKGLCECGIRNAKKPSRIHGGDKAMLGEFPWQVALLQNAMVITNQDGTTRQERGNPYHQTCGGTLVGVSHVITAGHCITDETTGAVELTSKYSVLVGATNLVVHEEIDELGPQRFILDVEDIRRHDKYRKDLSGALYYDIAVLVLTAAIPLQLYPNIKPACLPWFQDLANYPDSAITSGWGRTGPSPAPARIELQYADIKILGKTDKECQGMGTANDGTRFCALGDGTTQKNDACQKDSGGPVVIKDGNKYILVGITSYGGDCADNLTPGFYADVAYLFNKDNWLMGNLLDAKSCPCDNNGNPTDLIPI